MRMISSSSSLRLALIVLFVGLPTTAAIPALRQQSLHSYAATQEDEDVFYLPPSNWVKIMSVGYTEAIADLIWIKTVVYFGELPERWSKGKKGFKINPDTFTGGGANFTFNYLKTVTDLDPYFYSAYNLGYALTLFHRGRIDYDTVLMAQDLVRQGLKYFPTDGELAFKLGYNLYYEAMPFLESPKYEELRYKSRTEGLYWIKRSSLMPNAPYTAAGLSATLLNREGMKDLMTSHLSDLLYQETDENIRATLEFRLRQALGENAQHEIERSEEVLRQWRASMPFVPLDMYLILAEDPREKVAQTLNPLYASDIVWSYDDESLASE